MRFRSFASNSFLSAVENLSSPIMLFISYKILLKQFGPEFLGLWVLANTFITFSSLFFLGLSDSALVFSQNLEDSKNKNFSNLFVSMMSLFIVLFLISSLLLSTSVNLMKSIDNKIIFWSLLVGGIKTFEYTLFSYFKSEYFVRSSILGAISRTFVILFQLILIVKTQNIYTSLMGTFLLSFLWLLVELKLLPIASNFNSSLISLNKIKQILNFSMPFWFQVFVSQIHTQFDKIIVADFVGIKTLAYYSIAQSIAYQIHNVLAGTSQWIVPHFAKLRFHKDSLLTELSGFQSHFRKMLIFGFMLSLPIIHWGLPAYLGTETYKISQIFIILFLIFEFFLAKTIIPFFTLNAIHKSKLNLKIYSLMCFVTLLLGVAFHFLNPSGLGLIWGRILATLIFALVYKITLKQVIDSL